MKRDDTVYLRHILDAVLKIQEYAKDATKSSFGKNTLVQDGVIRQIEIVGEAAKRLSPRTRKDNNDIPWDDVAGMRDKPIHDYFGVDLDIVWQTVRKDIPALKKVVSRILSSGQQSAF